ncbi:nitrite reductase (NAD(P)H) small subunit [Vibrio orientalis CIP 102891 = ATCC 33934]|uniref:Nitrite reductase (NAD(P)H) small subunit n=2 Tax=Vibrio orientalis CIP 102891 = ATCC 33934 TaxID=675816 RepID=F9SVI5_VIBOR|nr:nitrite reductase small subunit NirD [Vibrio orientalis]EGU48287.1 nitrite reductase (NAD(P)H) small subunit [Vibrio orientalis CIP 102891 = ATCC 33934]
MDTLIQERICRLDELPPYQGCSAMIGGEQVALFNIPSAGVFAVQNWDPIGQAFVISRGIVGDVKGQLCVASPLYKQHFCLKSGQCIENDEVKLCVYPVAVENGNVVLTLN